LRGATFPAADFVSDPDQPNAKEQTYVTRRIKARAIHDKSMQRLDPPGGAWGFFGYHTIPHDAKELVLTEGEYDAMAVWQATGRPAISLPNGCRSLPVETLPMLENIEKIYLWMDNDAPGQEGAQLFAKKLGHARCYIVRPTRQNVTSEELPKDANDALRSGCDLNKIIDDAKLMPHEHITNFEELRADVLHEIMYPDKFMGTGLPSLPKFTSIIKGLRRGELTILTGPTGSG
jgi:twinkle protein